MMVTPQEKKDSFVTKCGIIREMKTASPFSVCGDDKGYWINEIEEVSTVPRATIVKVLDCVKKSEFKRKLSPIATMPMIQTLWWLDKQ
jgi:hypothetical protein